MMFADPPRSLYLLLIVAAIISGAVCAKYQNRKMLIAFAAACLALLGLYLADFFVESPREEATRRVIAMAKSAEAGNEAEFMSHVAGSYDRPIPWHLIHQHKPRITVWDFSRDDTDMTKGMLTIGFMAKGEAPGGLVLKYVQAIFSEQPGGAWKLKGVTFFNPASKQPEPLP